MSFDNLLLLHGKGGSPEGSVKDIEALLRSHYIPDYCTRMERFWPSNR